MPRSGERRSTGKMAADRLFVDTNVLVYATVAESPFHQHASRALEQARGAGAELWISSQVLREFLVVMTRPGLAQDLPPLGLLLNAISSFRSFFHVAFSESGALDRLLELMQSTDIGGKQVHDAHIIATMQVHDIPRLLTHNVSDFKRFASLIEVVPLLEAPPDHMRQSPV